MEELFNSSTRMKIILALVKDESHALTTRQLRIITGSHNDSIQKQCQILKAHQVIEKKNIERNTALWKLMFDPNLIMLLKRLDELLNEKIGGNNYKRQGSKY